MNERIKYKVLSLAHINLVNLLTSALFFHSHPIVLLDLLPFITLSRPSLIHRSKLQTDLSIILLLFFGTIVIMIYVMYLLIAPLIRLYAQLVKLRCKRRTRMTLMNYELWTKLNSPVSDLLTSLFLKHLKKTLYVTVCSFPRSVDCIHPSYLRTDMSGFDQALLFHLILLR